MASSGRNIVVRPSRRFTTAVFFRRRTKELHPLVMPVPTGFSSGIERARLANNDHAFDNGYTHWAQWSRRTLASAKRVEEWLVFECLGRARYELKHTLPTQAAAEMWMVHHA